MLYDNALLIDLMCEAYRESGNELYKVRIAETVDWLLREMIAEGGGFAASLDADSEGEEGKFYVWSRAEILNTLGGSDGVIFCEAYDVTGEGNWEGHTILNRLHELELRAPEEEAVLAGMRRRLLEHRAGRIRPGWDDKVLADWNGLMIAALVHAAQVFDRLDWLAAAKTAFAFVVSAMEKEGRLIHSYRAGQARAPATASDYANMAWGALRLHQATGDAAYLDAAERWVAVLDARYWELDAGGYAFTADDTPDVIVRMRGAHDDATPNANAIMISNLMALNLLTGKQAYLERAHALPKAFAADLAKNLSATAGCSPASSTCWRRSTSWSLRPAAQIRLCRAPCSACLCPAPSSRSSVPASLSPAPPLPAKPRSTASLPPTPASARNAPCPSPMPTRWSSFCASSGHRRRLRAEFRGSTVLVVIWGLACLGPTFRYSNREVGSST